MEENWDEEDANTATATATGKQNYSNGNKMYNNVNTGYYDYGVTEANGRMGSNVNTDWSVTETDGCSFDYYQNNKQTNVSYTEAAVDEWGSTIASNDQYNGDVVYDGYDNQTQDSWDNNVETKNYQSNGGSKSISYGKTKSYPKKSTRRENNDANNEPGKLKSTYIPPEFEENDNLTIEAGSNFEKYDKIEVTVSGMDVPKNITSFHSSGLHEILLSNLSNCHYTIPTPIQKYALPIIMSGRDMIASAQTGSGKTAAFLLPILHSLLNEGCEVIVDYNHCEPQVLIIAPTRELTIQICEVATRLSKGTGIKSELVYGGTATYYQKQRILRGINILVATPGRLLDFVKRGLITFSSLKFLVLDEADRMLDMGFGIDVERVLNHNTMVSSAERTTLMFSATLPESVQQIAKLYLQANYISVGVGDIGGACKDVTQTFIKVKKFDKRNELLKLLKETGDCHGIIVFVEQKRQADFIAVLLSELNYPTTSIHGDREQPEREKALKDFKTKKMQILVATSVAARGLDIIGVRMVVNFDLPKTVEEYVHRIGRTGRLGNFGQAVSFYDPEIDNVIAPGLVNTLRQADQKIPEFLLPFENGENNANADFITQFNDIRTDVTVHSEYYVNETFARNEEEETW